MANFRKYFIIQLLAALLFFSGLPAQAQNTISLESLPRVGVAPLDMNEPDNIQLNIISERVRETAVLILRYLDNYEFQRDVQTQPPDYDNASLLQYCETHRLDSLVYGKTYQRPDGSFIIEMSVYSRERGSTTLTRIEEAQSALDIFEAADNITYSLIEGFSGRRIAFGRITLNHAGPEGEFIPFLDGEEYPLNSRVFDRVLIGKRELKILQVRMLGETEILSSIIEVREGEAAAVELRIPRLLAEEDKLIKDQEEIIKHYSESSVEKPRDRLRVVTAYNKIDALLINTDYNLELAELREQYRTQRAEWENLLAADDAQSDGKRKMTAGIKLGSSVSRIAEVGRDNGELINGYFDDDFNRQVNFPGMAGVFFELQLSPNWYVQPEVNKRDLVFYKDSSTGIDHFIKYFEIPLLFKYKVDAGIGRLGIIIGPGLNISSGSTGIFSDLEDDNSIGDNSGDVKINSGLFGTLGLEYSLSIKNHLIVLDVRFMNFMLYDGFLVISDTEDEHTRAFADILQFSFGYGYNFGGSGTSGRSDRKDGQPLKSKRWFIPLSAGIGIGNYADKSPLFLSAGFLYGISDRLLIGGNGVLIDNDNTVTPMLSFAWAENPRNLINQVSFIVLPDREDRLKTAFSYNIGIKRILIGAVGAGNYDRVRKEYNSFSAGVVAGYYF